MSSPSRSLARSLVAGRYLLLGLAAVAAAAAWLPAQRVTFDRSVENMFADDDPLLAPYRRLKQTFGGNEVVLAVYADDELFHSDRSGLDRLAAVRKRLDKAPGVQEVLTIDRPIGEAVVDPRSETAARTRELFENYTHDAAGQTAAAVCMLDPAGGSREDTVRALRAVMDSLPRGVGPIDGFDVRLRIDGLDLRGVNRGGVLRLIAGGEEQSVARKMANDVGATVSDWPIDRDGDGESDEVIRACRIEVKANVPDVLRFNISAHDRELPSGEVVAMLGRTVLAVQDGDEIVVTVDGQDAKKGLSKASRKTGAVVRVTVAGEKTSVAAARLPEALPRGYLTGEPAMIVEGFRLLEEDGRRLGLWSTIFLGATVIICFRSVWWVAIPVLVVQLAILLTNATFVWAGLELSMVSSMLTAIVTVIGVSMAIHVTVHFQEERALGTEPRLALESVLAVLILPIVFSAATDVAGFASLLAAGVRPVQDFGVMMAIGAAFSGVATMLIIPGLLTLARRPGEWLKRRSGWSLLDADPKSPWGQAGVNRRLHRMIGWAGRYPWVIGGLTLVLSAVAFLGSQRLEVETDFTRNFREGNEIVRSYAFVESRMGGAGVLDIMLPAPQRLEWDYLSLVQSLERKLRSEVVVTGEGGRSEPGLTKVLSLSDAVIAAAGDLDRQGAMMRRLKVNAALGVMQNRLPSFYAALYARESDSNAADRHSLRIMLRARERQPAEAKRKLIAQVRAIVDRELAGEEWQAFFDEQQGAQADNARGEVTGFFVLLTNLIDSMLAGQWAAFLVATAAIGAMSLAAMLLCDEAFIGNPPRRDGLHKALWRSSVLAAIAQAPNALPIFLVLGAMGWLGLKINLGAVMISAVSMGLSVDMSLHYLISFRRLHAAGASVDEALAEVQKSVGRAMVFSTLALIVGFTTLCVSDFVPTIYFGALVSLSMLGGMFGNLLVLPMLIKIAVRERDRMTGSTGMGNGTG